MNWVIHYIKNLGPDIIESRHIKNKSLGDRDFAEGAFTAAKIADGTAGSSNFAPNGIQEQSISENIKLQADKFTERGVHWDDFVQPPKGMFPDDRISDNSLSFDDKFIDGTNIDGENLLQKVSHMQSLTLP